MKATCKKCGMKKEIKDLADAIDFVLDHAEECPFYDKLGVDITREENV
jgi:hypothetical protein